MTPMQRSTERISVESGGANVEGRIFLAPTETRVPTAIIVPGWPGNPDDVLGLGVFLSHRGVNAIIFNPRGLHNSGGESTFANTIDDIRAVVRWARSNGSGYQIDKDLLFLGGYSYGGGMALAYASTDPTTKWVFSIAGTDHAQLIRKYQQDQEFAAFLRTTLSSTAAPYGPVRFDVEAALAELSENQQVFGLRENAASLAERSLLLIGGWDDQNVTVDEYLLPFYRELRKEGASDVKFLVFHDDHEFANVRMQISQAILEWIQSKAESA